MFHLMIKIAYIIYYISLYNTIISTDLIRAINFSVFYIVIDNNI